jgi:hypothetical protein
MRLVLERTPNKPADYEEDYEYHRQCESSVIAACPAGRVHVTQDASPEKMRRRAGREKPARRSTDATSASAFSAQRKFKMHVPYTF